MDRIKIMPTVDTKSDVMVIADPKEETIQRFIEAGHRVISESENELQLLKVKRDIREGN